MRKTITALLTSMLLCIAFTACEKESTTSNENNGSGNNNGFVITNDETGIELNMSNNGNDKIYFETGYLNNYGSISSAGFYLALSSSNNFYLRDNNGNLTYDIARVGNVAGMSAINSIPSSGWVKQVAVSPGTGYIIRYCYGNGIYTYARLFVKDWITSTGGGIIGATVIYQDNFGNALVGTKWERYDGFEQLQLLEFISGNTGLFSAFAGSVVLHEEEFIYYCNYTLGTIVLPSDGTLLDFRCDGNKLIVSDTMIFTKI